MVFRALVFLYLLTAPLLVYGVPSPLGNVRPARVLLLVLVCIAIHHNMFKARLRINLVDSWVFFVFVVTFLYYLVDPIGAGPSAYMGGLLECILIYWVFNSTVFDKITSIEFARLYVISSIPSVLIAIYQILSVISGNFDASLVPFPEYALSIYDRVDSISAFGVAGLMTRLSSATNEPNVFGIYMVSIAILSLGLAQMPGMKRWIWNSFFLVSLVFCMLTFSKSAFIGLIFALMYFNPRFFLTKGSLILIFLMVGMGVFFPEIIEARFSADNIDSGHVEHTAEALKNISFIGLGPGEYDMGSSHRFLLTLAIIFGVLGVIIFAYLIVVIIAKILLVKLNGFDRVLAAAFLAVFAGLNLYDYYFYFFIWIFFAVLSRLSNFQSGVWYVRN
jgi:hypothetical protein